MPALLKSSATSRYQPSLSCPDFSVDDQTSITSSALAGACAVIGNSSSGGNVSARLAPVGGGIDALRVTGAVDPVDVVGHLVESLGRLRRVERLVTGARTARGRHERDRHRHGGETDATGARGAGHSVSPGAVGRDVGVDVISPMSIVSVPVIPVSSFVVADRPDSICWIAASVSAVS